MALENVEPKVENPTPEAQDVEAQAQTEAPKTEEAAPKAEQKKEEPEKKLSTEEQLQQLMIDYVKLKKASDQNAKEAADFKKKWRATLDEKEVASMEKAEAEAKKDARLAELERKDQIHDLTEQFMDLGYSKDTARKAAEAQVDGDQKTLFSIQKAETDRKVAEAEAQWLKTRPQVQAGADEAEQDPFLKGFMSVKSPFGN